MGLMILGSLAFVACIVLFFYRRGSTPTRVFLVGSLLIMTWGAAAAEDYNVGVSRITTKVAGVEVPVRMFYPTAAEATETRFGPWELVVARNADPASGSFPLIVISHGLGGNDWNHHLLAQRLVAKGFVVAAVRHPDDLKRVGRQAILVLRPLEVRAAIDQVLKDGTFGKIVDADRIGGFGFSQGGLTVLRTLGADAEHQKLIDHCEALGKDDEEFCFAKSAGMLQRLGFAVSNFTYTVPEFDPDQSVVDERIKVAVVAAPVGAPITGLASVKRPVWLIRAGSDDVLKFPFHAEAIHKSLASSHDYTVLDGIEHYAFLSPFPESIKPEVGLPAIDPEGFDRAGFLEKTNQAIVEYFLKHLVQR